MVRGKRLKFSIIYGTIVNMEIKEHEVIEDSLNKVWWDESPYKDIPADNFGADFETYIRIPEEGKYALGVEGFYGYKYYVNDSLVFKYSTVHHPRKKFYLRHCKAGEVLKVRIEYKHEKVNHALVRLLWGRSDTDGQIERAVALAKRSDVVVLCVGINQNLEGEEMTVKTKGFSGGDRTEIGLPDTQRKLVKRISELGKPVIMVLLNGSPLSVPEEHNAVNAVIEGWYGGQAAGTAVADVLFGDYNPSGRLPVTVYRSIDQLPDFTDYSMKGRTYRYFAGNALYEFGYGLSYTTFEYTDLKVPERRETNKAVEISVKVTNTGNRDGDEIVQLYVSRHGLPFETPIRSLKGFKRISLKKGEARVVSFTLQPEELAVVDDEGRIWAMPGEVLLSIGGKQPDKKSLENKKVIEKKIELTGEKINL